MWDAAHLAHAGPSVGAEPSSVLPAGPREARRLPHPILLYQQGPGQADALCPLAETSVFWA